METTHVKKKNQRRNYLINPRLQFGLTGLFLTLATLNVAIFYFGYKVLVVNLLDEINLVDTQSSQLLAKALTLQSATIERAVLFFCLFILMYHVLIGVVIFHHIAGPAYAIKKHLKRLKDGETPPKLILRKYDFFSDIVEELNALTAKLSPEQKWPEESEGTQPPEQVPEKVEG